MRRNNIPISLAAPVDKARREREEDLHRYRTEFERDRDRILYSKAFRRLTGKTQIFLPLSHDHVRNRLTHTLEVAQVANVTAKNLFLDLDLTEAISLGHDLGHTPFGHVGERTLNMATNNCEKIKPFIENIRKPERGFKHNLHGLRVVIHLEKNNKDFPGMNLTNFTLWGIKHHSKINYEKIDINTGDPIPCKYYNAVLYKAPVIL